MPQYEYIQNRQPDDQAVSPLIQQIQRISLCSDNYPEPDRFDAWQDEVVKRYLQHDLARLPGDTAPFFQRSTTFILGEMTLSCFEGSAIRASRSRQQVADGNDDFVFRINRQGAMHLSHLSHIGGRTSRAVDVSNTAGVLASNALVSESIYGPINQYGRLYAIRIPRKALSPVVRDVDAGLLQYTSMTGPLLNALIRLADDFFVGHMDHLMDQPENVASHFLDLVCMILGPTGDAREQANRRGLRDARRASIFEYVKHCFLSPDLKVAHVAHYLDTTERYVQQLLEESGTTFSELVLHSRLKAACEKLTNAALRELPISAVAAQCGFSDVSYFNRAFKRRFDKTPREFRRQEVHAGPAASA